MKVQQVSFSGIQTFKTQEQIENEQFIMLCKEYKNKPYLYERNDYFKNGETKEHVHGKSSCVNVLKNFVKKIGKLCKKIY